MISLNFEFRLRASRPFVAEVLDGSSTFVSVPLAAHVFSQICPIIIVEPLDENDRGQSRQRNRG